MARNTITAIAAGTGEVAPALRFHLLGGFRAVVDDEPVPDDAWARRKAQAVVKLLALAAGHALHREEVLEALWPEAEPAAARNSLNQALHAARRALGPASAQLRVAAERLILVPPVWVDVAAFEGAALAARRSSDPALYEVALTLYTGELLPENRYEDWAAGRREALRGTRLTLLSELARLQEGRGALDLAVAALERAVEQEPANEEAHVALIRLHARAGRRDVAMRHWARLRDALRRDLDVAPSPASEAAYRDVLADTAAPPRAPAAPAIPPSARRAHNLPASLTSLIGRLRERAAVRELLERGAGDAGRAGHAPDDRAGARIPGQVPQHSGSPPRFVTLLGPGGAGKTRLALAVGHDLVGAFSDGVWLVELAGLADPALVPAALAAALGVGEVAGRALTDSLVEALRPRELLLVLDNCEHLIDACALLAEQLLTHCPDLRILATSRAALRVPGELAWVVPPLAVPAPRDAGAPPLTEGDLAVLARADALSLLIERARLRQPAFGLTTANAHALLVICRRLDGLPLALELAAARLAHLAPAQISARLDDALALLTGGSRSAPTRQQTLRAALDWSYATLDEAERVALRRLAPFAGGFDLAAAEAVCDDHTAGNAVASLSSAGHPPRAAAPAHSAPVLDLLGSLVDKSLLSVEADGGHARYRTLEVVRQYAAEQLRASGEEAPTRGRHAAHYLALAEEAEPHLQGPQQRTRLDHLEREADNLRAAGDWLIAGGDARDALRLSGALWWYWYVRGHLAEGRERLARALALPAGTAGGDRPDPPRAKVLLGAGVLAWRQGHLDRAHALCAESATLVRGRGDDRGEAWALVFLAHVLGDQREFAAARAMGAEALAIFRALDDRAGLARTLNGAGEDAQVTGDFARAEGLYRESLALDRELGDAVGLILRQVNLGYVVLRRGAVGEAASLFREGLLASRALDHRRGIANCLNGLANVAITLRRYETGAALFAAAETIREAIGETVGVVSNPENERYIARARDSLGPGPFTDALASGRVLPAREASAVALGIAEAALAHTS